MAMTLSWWCWCTVKTRSSFCQTSQTTWMDGKFQWKTCPHCQTTQRSKRFAHICCNELDSFIVTLNHISLNAPLNVPCHIVFFLFLNYNKLHMLILHLWHFSIDYNGYQEHFYESFFLFYLHCSFTKSLLRRRNVRVCLMQLFAEWRSRMSCSFTGKWDQNCSNREVVFLLWDVKRHFVVYYWLNTS